MKEWILKKRSVWFHLIVGYLTGGIWLIIFGIAYFSKRKKENNSEELERKNIIQEKKIVYNKEIKIAGTSFHQKELQQIVRKGLNEHYITPYNGLNTKELKESNNKVGQIEFEKLKSINLQPYNFKNEIAIKLLVNDYLDNYIEVGNIPKEEVNNLLPFIEQQENYNFNVDGYFVGGKYKQFDLFEEKMITEELNIGIHLKIKISEK